MPGSGSSRVLVEAHPAIRVTGSNCASARGTRTDSCESPGHPVFLARRSGSRHRLSSTGRRRQRGESEAGGPHARKERPPCDCGGNGREALDALEKDTFDLVFMDVQMPVMGGFEATSTIREREKGTGGHQIVIA